jgi:hypothetical protein
LADKPIAPRTVKPRKSGYRHSPIMSVSMETDEIYVERTGELLPFAKLAMLICSEPASIVVATNAGKIVKYLDELLDDNPRWQFKLSPVNQEHWGPNRVQRRTITMKTIVGFMGFQAVKDSNGKKIVDSLYHYPIEPDTFSGKTIHELKPGELPRIMKLYEWAKDIRTFLQLNNLVVRPTAGGIAGQLLRDKRFYPDARRKVPQRTNARARDQLPGNYYRLFVKERTHHTAVYLDQKSAHHSCVLDIDFPDANSLFAKGHFYNPPDKPMATAGTPRFKRLIAEHGLFLVTVRNPQMPPTVFPLPCMEREGLGQAWIFSNEISYLEKYGCKIESIIAQWTSPDVEHGLNAYAKWSLHELSVNHSDRTQWLKPLLLSTYGILAAKPKAIEVGFKRANSGQEKMYPVGSGVIKVLAKSSNAKHEMPTANVIHRGMIEAETRLRSVKLAREVSQLGMKVLAIYADSVFVDTNGKKMPLLDNRWQVKGELQSLQFFSSTSFTSDVLTKLPGIPKDGLDTVRRLEHVRNLTPNSAKTRERNRLRNAEPDTERIPEPMPSPETHYADSRPRPNGSVRPG